MNWSAVQMWSQFLVSHTEVVTEAGAAGVTAIFFRQEHEALGIPFHGAIPVICEEFTVVWPDGDTAATDV